MNEKPTYEDLEQRVAYLEQGAVEFKLLQVALQESESKYRTLVENAADIIYWTNEKGNFTFLNPACTKLSGYRPEDLIGRHFGDIVRPDYRKQVLRFYDHQVSRKIPVTYCELPLITRDNRALWIGQQVQIILREGQLTGYQAIGRDITERKQIEVALLKSEQKFAAAFHLNPNPMIISELLSGIFIDVNKAFNQWSGFQRADVIGVSSYNFGLWADHADRVVMVRRMQENGEVNGMEVLLKRKDGALRNVHFSTRFIELDGEKRLLSLIHDITDRQRAEQARRENLEILAEAERIGQTGSWKRVLDTNELVWSAGTRRIMGLAPDEKESFARFQALVHTDDLPGLREKLLDIAARGTPFTAEFRITRPDGVLRHIVGRAEAKLDGQNRPFLVYGTVQDVTEHKMLEDELIKAQKLDSIGILAGGLAHDYNNLLTVIMGYLDLLKLEIPPATPSGNHLTRAGKAAASAQELTRQLITFSEGGYPVCKILSIREIFVQSVQLALSGSGMETEIKIAENLPPVKVDENQIRQVIQNIAINAREAGPPQGRLLIAADRTVLGEDNPFLLSAGLYVRLLLRDQGPGIAAGDMQHIFDPYFSTKSRGGTRGMGLGLPICYSILKRHRGHITVESDDSSGTTVTIYIPAAAETPVSTAAPA